MANHHAITFRVSRRVVLWAKHAGRKSTAAETNPTDPKWRTDTRIEGGCERENKRSQQRTTEAVNEDLAVTTTTNTLPSS
jgi:hypothetical protein